MRKLKGNMKGISLPIDMLVILAIAVIVLIAVIAVFMGVWNPFATGQQQRADFTKACTPWVNQGCPSSALTADSDICKKAVGYVLGVGATTDCATNINNIKRACGCAVV